MIAAPFAARRRGRIDSTQLKLQACGFSSARPGGTNTKGRVKSFSLKRSRRRSHSGSGQAARYRLWLRRGRRGHQRCFRLHLHQLPGTAGRFKANYGSKCIYGFGGLEAFQGEGVCKVTGEGLQGLSRMFGWIRGAESMDSGIQSRTRTAGR